MGDRALFQDTETDIEFKDIYRHKWKRITYKDLDSHDIASDNKMDASSVKNEMVVLKHECNAKNEPVYVPIITGVAW